MNVSREGLHRFISAKTCTAPKWSVARLAAVFVVLLLGSSPAPADAGVSLLSGNFYITYNDIECDGGMELKISRTYNSISGYRGVFGKKWGAPIQTVLNPLPDGSVLVDEGGGGARNLFAVEDQEPGHVDKTAELLRPFKRWIAQELSEKEYFDEIRSDADFRIEEERFLYREKQLAIVDPPVGTILKSLRYGSQYIVRIPSGYCRFSEGGRKEFFEMNGRLTRIEDANNNWQSIAYGNQGLVSRISDNLGRSLEFSYNGQGLLEKVKTDIANGSSCRNKETSYEYNGLRQLIESRDISGNAYRYEYDKNTNLTAVRYIDGTSNEIRYYPSREFESVKSVMERNGSLFSYEYHIVKADSTHFQGSTSITETLGGKPVRKTTYDQYTEVTASGEWIRRRDVVTTNGNSVAYDNDDQRYVLKMTNLSGESSYLYDDRHSLVRRETPQEINIFEYNQVNHKLTSYTETDKAGALKRKIQYSFDDQWRLLSAVDNQGNKLEIEYADGDISKIIFNSTVAGFTKKNGQYATAAAYEGGKLLAEYDLEKETGSLVAGVGEDEGKRLDACFTSIVSYYQILREKANVRISGHPENCTCTINQYEIPHRLAVLQKIVRSKPLAARTP